ncbi:aminopeptidase N-like [Drosophila miranda]|uniref:aminopeptidase N-like n=1 Tax=Drosophila miranda TaxID=7229 RepID=UPI0007E6C69D|nr:aminopeptidase N-like [Drosophila miranda]
MPGLLYSLICCGLFCLPLCGSEYTYPRLPKSVKPLSYNLKVLTHLHGPKKFTFEGEVHIQFVTRVETDNITLHVGNITIHESKIKIIALDGNDTAFELDGTGEVPERQYYMLYVNVKFVPDVVYELRMAFSGDIIEAGDGYYWNKYTDRQNDTRFLTATQFQPTLARDVFPCFDEPSLKANFTIILGHDKAYHSLSNMPVKKITPHPELHKYVWTEFEETVPMPTYLVAFSVNDFDHTTTIKSDSGVEFRSWARHDTNATTLAAMIYGNVMGFQVLQSLETLFGINYALPKMDQMAVPNYTGAMEHWGLVTYQESRIFCTDDTTVADRHAIAGMVAHEMAHQWFGNLVTAKWWSDVWLNEGFASYLGCYVLQDLMPNQDPCEHTIVTSLRTIFSEDANNNSQSFSRSVMDGDEISATFDEFSYGKGGIVFRMLHHFLGSDAFKAGMRDYLKRFAYGNAGKKDLWEAFTRAADDKPELPANISVATIMNSWTRQPGYPLINVTRNYDTGSADITQQRFLQDQQEDTREDCWWIPLSFTTAKRLDFMNTEPRHWFQCPSDSDSGTDSVPDVLTIPLHVSAQQWVIFNLRISGLYKVNYDRKNWELLVDTLNSEHFSKIHALNRAQLVDDSLLLAWSGYIQYDVALPLVRYLSRELEAVPWLMAMASLQKLTSIMRRTAHYPSFRGFAQLITTPIYKHLGGLKDKRDLSLKKQILKAQLVSWACANRVARCIKDAKDLFLRWRSASLPDQHNPIPVDLRPAVYCTAIAEGDEINWYFLWRRYNSPSNLQPRGMLLSALACTQRPWVVLKLLDFIMRPKGVMPDEDVIAAVDSLTNQDVGFHIAKAYLIERFTGTLPKSRRTVVNFTHLLIALTRKIHTESDARYFSGLIRLHIPNIQSEEIMYRLRQAVSTMVGNVKWRARHAKTAASALRKAMKYKDTEEVVRVEEYGG